MESKKSQGCALLSTRAGEGSLPTLVEGEGSAYSAPLVAPPAIRIPPILFIFAPGTQIRQGFLLLLRGRARSLHCCW